MRDIWSYLAKADLNIALGAFIVLTQQQEKLIILILTLAALFKYKKGLFKSQNSYEKARTGTDVNYLRHVIGDTGFGGHR